MSRWPFPADTPTERARRIANSLLALIADDVERKRAVEQAHRYGETWLGATLLRFTPDDVVRPAEAAGLVDVTPAILRNWVRLKVLYRTGDGYRVGDVLDASASIRRRRAVRKRAGQA